MAAKKWLRLPGGRGKRWKKSRGDERPGWGTCRFDRWTPPHSYRNMLNRRDRRRAVRAVSRGDAEARPYVHPREAGWFW
jgi:hypothetical protein